MVAKHQPCVTAVLHDFDYLEHILLTTFLLSEITNFHSVLRLKWPATVFNQFLLFCYIFWIICENDAVELLGLGNAG